MAASGVALFHGHFALPSVGHAVTRSWDETELHVPHHAFAWHQGWGSLTTEVNGVEIRPTLHPLIPGLLLAAYDPDELPPDAAPGIGRSQIHRAFRELHSAEPSFETQVAHSSWRPPLPLLLSTTTLAWLLGGLIVLLRAWPRPRTVALRLNHPATSGIAFGLLLATVGLAATSYWTAIRVVHDQARVGFEAAHESLGVAGWLVPIGLATIGAWTLHSAAAHIEGHSQRTAYAQRLVRKPSSDETTRRQ